MPVIHTAQFQSHMKQPDDMQNQPCPLMGACGPKDIPEGFELESSVPAVKSKVKTYISGTLLNADLHERFKSEIQSHTALLFTHHPFSSPRDVLTTNSILII